MKEVEAANLLELAAPCRSDLGQISSQADKAESNEAHFKCIEIKLLVVSKCLAMEPMEPRPMEPRLTKTAVGKFQSGLPHLLLLRLIRSAKLRSLDCLISLLRPPPPPP